MLHTPYGHDPIFKLIVCATMVCCHNIKFIRIKIPHLPNQKKKPDKPKMTTLKTFKIKCLHITKPYTEILI